MDRENIARVITFLQQYSEDFSTAAESLEGYLTETTDQVVMAAEDDLDNLQTILTEMTNEAQDVLFLISEMLP